MPPAERPRLSGDTGVRRGRGVVRCSGEECSAIPGGCPVAEKPRPRRAKPYPRYQIRDRASVRRSSEHLQFPRSAGTARISSSLWLRNDNRPLTCRPWRSLQNRPQLCPSPFRVRDTTRHLSSSSGRTFFSEWSALAVRSPVEEGEKPRDQSRWIIGIAWGRKGWGSAAWRISAEPKTDQSLILSV